jgi:hypothetical protein
MPNTLSLDPTDERWRMALESWEDGGEYAVNITRMKQTAPGEFDVLEAEPTEIESENPEESAGQPEETEPVRPPTPPKAGSGSKENPAIAFVISAGKRK